MIRAVILSVTFLFFGIMFHSPISIIWRAIAVIVILTICACIKAASTRGGN